MNATRDWRRIEAVCWPALGIVSVALAVTLAGMVALSFAAPVAALAGTVWVLSRGWNRHRPPSIVQKDEFGRPIGINWEDLTL